MRGGQPLGRVSTTEALVTAMTNEILEGARQPGTHLPEVELADQFGVSRHSMRAAMAELVHHGLLLRQAHHGYWVRVLTVDDVRDLFLMRRMIEGEAVRHLVTWPRPLTNVAATVHDLEQLSEQDSWTKTVERHLAVHRAIVAAVGSQRMSRAHFYLETEFRLSHALARPRWSLPTLRQAHRELFNLIVSGEPEAAMRFVHDDIEMGLRSVLDALVPHVAPATPDDSEPAPTAGAT
jgi:DNA-binding GntR family transcriptional regulator